MNYHKTVTEALRYIEEHLKDDITLEALARHTGYSVYYFCRLFKSQTGIPVMDYVRRRRLVHALADMEKGKVMLGVALDYGFGTQGGMIKAFRRIYGVTPGHYRAQVSGKLPGGIQIGYIDPRRKGEKNMQINTVENQTVFNKVMTIADRMFNITAWGNRKYGHDYWRRQFAVTPELMIYAEDNGSVIGFCLGLAEDNAVTIAYAGVEKEYQNRGIEAALVTEMEKRTKALGYGLTAYGAGEGEDDFWITCGYRGLLLIQSEKNSIDELRALNPGLKEINARLYEGNVSQLFLDVPANDAALRKKYEAKYPDCNTIMVYTKKL